MKFIKILGVIALFGIVIYMALGLKQRIVQTSCKEIGSYKATKSEDVQGSAMKETWYCCPTNKDKTSENCVFYGE